MTELHSRKRILWWAVSITGVVALIMFQGAYPQWRFLPYQEILSIQTFLFIFLAAHFVEYLDSSLGMGYGTTLTPLLLLAGFTPAQVVPCVLLSELVTGITAALMHHRDGNVNFISNSKAKKTAFLLSSLSFFGALAAVILAVSIPKLWLNTIIGIIVLSVGIIVLATIRKKIEYSPVHIVAVGTVAAFNKGLSGGGYGPLTTAGQVVSGISPKEAVAITSLAESFTCLVGLSAYLMMGKNLDFRLAVPLVAGAVLSVPISTLTVKKVSEAHMRIGVGVATISLAVFLLVRTIC